MVRLLVVLSLATAAGLLGASTAAAQAPAPKVLLFHGGTSHASVTAGVDAITQLGDDNDFTVDATADPTAFTAQNLSGYRAVIALHSSGDVLNAGQRTALQNYVQGGGGFVGIGEAANLQPGDTFFSGLIGARPAASSSNAVTQQIVEVGDRVHPATRDLPLQWGPRSDAWYQWQQNPTGQVHTVARARFGATADDGYRNGTTSRPISWCRDFQGGRSFYTAMGRTAASYSEENFQKHLLGAIEWAGGLVRGGCKATIASNYESVRVTNGADGLANSGESHGVTVASNGWVLTIARAYCTSDAERGARIGQASFPRTLDFANPNVGVGCAPIHVWDPEQHNGTVNSGNTRAGTLTVYGDRGGGGEVNGKIETGGLGITASPDFAQTGHIYVLYFPSFNPNNPVQPGLDDGAQRRISKMGVGRISRFTIDLDTKRLDLASEVPIFEYDAQIYSCCHQGGGMGFDSEGNLYITTGDSNSSGGNYSGNWQSVRCATGPAQEVSNNHCGANGFSYRDARRTAGSTNDYNGKMLRINPIEDIADGADVEIGAGETYTLPTADSPNGPNLFNGSEGGGGLTKPEIYAMGLRNPSRLAIDPETDTPYSAWVGPDAGSPSVTLGPSTYEVASQIPRAGNWGWPYCMGNKQAYRDRTSASGDPLRTTNVSGYVTGGPAGAGATPGWYDCDNLVNDSTNNRGLQVLPHNTGTNRDAGKVAPANIWYSRGNPGGDGCPVFPRDNGANNAPNYAGQNTQLCPYYDGLGGHTVMSGPVYRYDEDAASGSRRWPAYWDGRWFVHDFSGGNAKSFGFLLDPETAAQGGQPAFVDKMSQYINWSGGVYMDSKFGPDGALYLQTYSGNYFGQGLSDGLHRISYTGGPDTPGPDPQWETTGANEIAFSIGRSGGISYEWDFGDGTPTSNATSPSHTYAQPGLYTAKLTVTYADGETASKTVEVNASNDSAAPTTTHALAPATPGAGGTYRVPVEVTLSATDATGGTGVEFIEYRVNTDGAVGEWQRADNGEQANPFSTTVTVEDEGSHVVEYRSRDRAGNTEDVKSVAFSIADQSSPGGTCLPQSDEFGGSALDGKWDVLRPAGTAPQVADGALSLEVRRGDFIANDALAENTLLQDTPDGEWTVTTRLNTSGINANGEQAGLVIWKSESPNTFSKLVAIQSSQGNHQFEHIVTQNGAVSPPIPQSITTAPGGRLPENVLLRARYDGTQVIGEFSADDGQSWTRVGQAGHAAPLEGPLRVGLVAFRGANGGGNVSFDWFRLNAGSEAGGPVECAATCQTRSDSFDGSLNTQRWSFRHPTTPATGARAPRTEGGNLVFPLGSSAIDQGREGPVNFLGQPLPEGDFTVEAKINAPGLDGDDSGEESPYAQVGLGLYQTDDDWIGVYQTRNGDSEQPGTDGGTYFEVKSESEGSRQLWPRVGQAAGSVNLPDYWLRVQRTGDTVTASYSLDDPNAGGQWVDLQATPKVSEVFDPADGPISIGPLGVNGSVAPTFEYIKFDPDLNCPGGCNPLSDQFNGNDLDPKWELVNPNTSSQPSVGGGHLTVPLVPGDLYADNGDAQMLLQQAPEGSWVATAKVAHANIDTDGEAAGLALINSLNPNHFLKTAVQYKSDTDPDTGGDQPGKWAERVLTSDDQAITLPPATVPWPNSGALDLDGDYVWVRFVHDADAQEITTWTSTDGNTFASFGADIPVDEYLSQPGGLRLGLFGKHDGSGDDEVQVDAFNVVGGTADPQTPGDDCGGVGASCPQTDEFDGNQLDSKWEVANPNPNALSVGSGHLTLTSGQGDVSGGAFSAQNILLQEVPEGPWTATVKLDHRAVAVNGQAAGMVIYGQHNPNYFAKTAIQYKDSWLGQPVNGIWVERILTTNGSRNSQYGGEFPNSGKVTPPTEYLWIRASFDGQNVKTEYSLDGETWAEQAPPFPASVLGTNGVTKIGLFVKHDGGNPAAQVKFDSFTVEAESCGGPVGDSTAPTTTHALDPAQPNGQGNWYTSPVKVTLSATDNEGGSGVATTEYRFAGDEEWTAYDGPFTVDDDGRHQLEYRSTDAAGNTENTRRVSFMIDSSDPTTTARLNGEEPASNYDGPVEVDLDADDGNGSGVRLTEVRVDGGEWKPYVEEEVILNSAQDLDAWEQAGPGGLNWVDQDGGFARTFGGLGMPWYPKEYGDFSLKLQWRDSSTGSNGNGGLFARFPHPDQTVARPADQRYPCQVGSAQNSPAWVAIFCGHEIQINDHQGDTQKTGSIYNFSPLNATQAKIQPRGTWVDYELRVVGQTYTILRNGEVLQEWQNAPDQQSSRAGDPPTNARQFARGYIGLQNHGNPDVIDYRNIRVLPLDAGSVRGPITVEGDGEHTVEYRSTDAAGNQEAVKDVTFTIGEADATAPVTEHSLDPATPGAGGTYEGPVDVTLSATDPEEGGPEPENHDVQARTSTWEPNQLSIVSGDTVTWNFPPDAGPPHDVWVIAPGEAPDSNGTQVADVTEPGGEPATETLEQTGTWRFMCKLHSLRSGGQWTGMTGTIEVEEAPAGTASGVDFTEYRVNTDGATGEWVKSENTGGDDPFETAFTVSDEGDHEVEYRSTDKAGNEEEIKSVAFSIAEEPTTDPDAPTVEAFADPSSGAAPLTVQFSATGLDPQGGHLDYEWRFDDGSGAFNQYVQRTYHRAGTYTATVIATDPQGKTASETVTVVVTEQGNHAPTVEAAANPKSGQAPLSVAFSARARDEDGPESDITYLWDFGDGGANAFGREASHTYMQPGTYTATVTATDRKGAFDTAELTIVVQNPPGNIAPTVQAAAAPRSGVAPLQVRFTSAATDPDGDQVSTVWDFGDGVKGGGPNINHTYRLPGTYTATVTVRDPGGLTDTDSVQITVRAVGQPSPPRSNPPSVSPPGQSGGDSGGVQGESATRPLVKAPKSRKVGTVKRRGLRLTVACADACRVKSVLRLSGQQIGKSKTVRIRADKRRTIVIRLNRNVRRNLLAAMRQAGVRSLRTKVVTTITTDDGKRTIRRTVTLKR